MLFSYVFLEFSRLLESPTGRLSQNVLAFAYELLLGAKAVWTGIASEEVIAYQPYALVVKDVLVRALACRAVVVP